MQRARFRLGRGTHKVIAGLLGLSPMGCHAAVDPAPPPSVAVAPPLAAGSLAGGVDAGQDAGRPLFPPPDSTEGADYKPARPPAPGEWIATRIQVPGLKLSSFVGIEEPSGEHPEGVIAALGASPDYGKPDDNLVRIDVATQRELGRTPLGAPGSKWITRTRDAVVVASQTEKGVLARWFGSDGKPLGGWRTLPGVGTRPVEDELRAFHGFDDRLVFVTGVAGVTHVTLLDDQGKPLSSHRCHGGLFSPGDAALAPMGDQVVLINLLPLGDGRDQPVCALHLHGAPRWREVVLPHVGGAMWADETGRIFVGSDDDVRWRLLTENLQPGEVVEPPPRQPPCWGLRGEAQWEAAPMGEAWVIWMINCCGGPYPGGLFVCRAPKGEDGGR